MLDPARDEQLILVDDRNRQIGTATKHAAHRDGLLHRAFSIFLVDRDGRLLIQQRHPGKYHSGGLWANACCGHPQMHEQTLDAAQRRLTEELGVATPLRFAFDSRYRTSLDSGMHENEFVHVYFGTLSEPIRPNPKEVIDVAFMTPREIRRAIEQRPQAFAYWFRHYFRAHYADICRFSRPAIIRTETETIAGQAALG